MSKFGMAVIEQGFFMTAIKVIDKGIKNLAIRCIRRFTKVQDNKILFLNFTGNYDCNPKWICEEFIREKAPVKLVWGINKRTRLGPMFFPKNVKTVVRGTYAFYKEIASAKVIIDNGISTTYLKYPKKRNQYLIETWHGSLGIKKFGRSANNDKSWLRKAAREGKMTDFIISNSTYEDAIYREDFWKKTKIWQFGHARNDILFCKDKKKIDSLQKKIRKEYDIPADAKLCMYAPTFRDDGDLSPYLIDYSALSSALKERFGGEWVILTRFHARTKKLVKYYTLPENVVNVSGYVDIQELMLCIDVGITDYSSWICEYMLRRKPGFMFATDVNDFSKHERSLFFPLSELPFPAASDVDTLIKNIKNFDEEKFVDDCNKFLEDKGSIDDGHAAERIVKEIRKLINC
ncbi:MAG: CDP-glycerol glycerophosphotransferase family protein [Acutalibacteraceae bacterium]